MPRPRGSRRERLRTVPGPPAAAVRIGSRAPASRAATVRRWSGANRSGAAGRRASDHAIVRMTTSSAIDPLAGPSAWTSSRSSRVTRTSLCSAPAPSSRRSRTPDIRSRSRTYSSCSLSMSVRSVGRRAQRGRTGGSPRRTDELQPGRGDRRVESSWPGSAAGARSWRRPGHDRGDTGRFRSVGGWSGPDGALATSPDGTAATGGARAAPATAGRWRRWHRTSDRYRLPVPRGRIALACEA